MAGETVTVQLRNGTFQTVGTSELRRLLETGQVRQDKFFQASYELLVLGGMSSAQAIASVRTNNPEAQGFTFNTGVVGDGEDGVVGFPQEPPFGGTPLEREQQLSTVVPGQGELFRSFLAGGFPDISPLVQRSVQSQFNPLSALFETGSAAFQGGVEGATDPGTFRQFLQGRDTGSPTGADFTTALEGLRPLIQLGGLRDDTQQAALGRLRGEDESRVRNLITQSLATRLTPHFRQFAPEIVDKQIGAFRSQDALSPLLDEFLRRGFTFNPLPATG